MGLDLEKNTLLNVLKEPYEHVKMWRCLFFGADIITYRLRNSEEKKLAKSIFGMRFLRSFGGGQSWVASLWCFFQSSSWCFWDVPTPAAWTEETLVNLQPVSPWEVRFMKKSLPRFQLVASPTHVESNFMNLRGFSLGIIWNHHHKPLIKRSHLFSKIYLCLRRSNSTS